VSRYSKKVAISQDELRTPRLLTRGVPPDAKKALEDEIKQLNEDLLESERSVADLRARREGLEKQMQGSASRLKNAKDSLGKITKHHQSLERAKRKLMEAEELAVSDNPAEKKKLVRRFQLQMKSCVTALEAHADQQAQIMQFTFSQAGVRINQDISAAAMRRAE